MAALTQEQANTKDGFQAVANSIIALIGKTAGLPQNAKQFGAKVNAVDDDAPGINSAIAAIQTEFENKPETGGAFILPSGKYKMKSTVTIPRDLVLDGKGGALDFSELPINQPAIIISENVSTTVGSHRGNINDLIIIGKAVSGLYPKVIGELENGVAVTENQWLTGSTGILSNTHEISLNRVSVRGFEKGIDYGTNGFFVIANNCQFRNNKTGVFFDGSILGRTNLGENIRFVNCVISNNREGISNKLGGLFFHGCSIDYNRVHVSKNETKNAGYSSGHLQLSSCWIETTDDRTMIYNDGSMFITDSDLWFQGSVNMIQNNDELILGPNNYRVNFDNTPYLVAGNAPRYTPGFGITGNDIPCIHPSLNNLPNGDFSQDITGWTIDAATGIHEWSATKKRSGTKSLLQTGDLYVSAISYSSFIPVKGRIANVNAWVNNSDHVQGHFISVVEYDAIGTLIKSNDIYINVNAADVFFKFMTGSINLDQRTQLIKIKLTGCNASKKTYWDDINLDFK